MEDLKANIIGRNILPKVDMKPIHGKLKHSQILNNHEKDETSDKEIKKWIQENFRQLCVQIGE